MLITTRRIQPLHRHPFHCWSCPWAPGRLFLTFLSDVALSGNLCADINSAHHPGMGITARNSPEKHTGGERWVENSQQGCLSTMGEQGGLCATGMSLTLGYTLGVTPVHASHTSGCTTGSRVYHRVYNGQQGVLQVYGRHAWYIPPRCMGGMPGIYHRVY